MYPGLQKGKYLASGLHIIRLIHEIGFPGWPEPNLD